MESSKRILELSQTEIALRETTQKDEVYQMPRSTVSNKPLRKGKSKRKGSAAEPQEINQTLKLAARSYGASHRLNIEGESLAQDLLHRGEATKKKGLFFLCC